jgi:hypothetical protein
VFPARGEPVETGRQKAVEELTDEELKLAERSLAESEARMKGEQVVSPRLRWVS